VRALRPLLVDADIPTHFTREPGGTPVAERIRGLVLDPGVEMEPWTEAYLYAAARADHARHGILPHLVRGENVVCERYLDSSLAYQGYGRELGVQAVRELNAWAVATVVPDRTFYLRLGAEERIEKVGDAFWRRVEEGFEALIRLEPARIEALDGRRSPEELAELIVGEIQSLQYTRGGD
jgi:dTMP kinase